MRIPTPRSARKARIEIIPLIDIIFFLLATFVMVSLSMVKNQGIGVHLPKAQTAVDQGGEKDVAVVSVTESGEIYLNKKRVSPWQLPAELKALKAGGNDPMILLNGDEKALLGRAIFVLDEARKSGIKKFAIAAKQAE